jgi:hypothetical protein
VAAIVSDISGTDKFHCSTFPETWFKVDVKEALLPNVPLMYPYEANDQNVVKDVVGGNALWEERLIRKCSKNFFDSKLLIKIQCE